MSYDTISLYQSGDKVRLIQRALNELMMVEIPVSGVFDPVTQGVLSRLQTRLGVKENDRFGPCYGPMSRDEIERHISERFITEEEIQQQASWLGIEVSVLKTVISCLGVEFGFLPDGELCLAFNERLFFDLYRKEFGHAQANELMCSQPDVCSTGYSHYCGGHKEVVRFKKASRINEAIAIRSASYGKFQTPGILHEACGFEDPYSFYEYLKRSEDNQLKVLCRKIKANSMLNESLIRRDWMRFCRKYFGAANGIENMALLFESKYRQLLS